MDIIEHFTAATTEVDLYRGLEAVAARVKATHFGGLTFGGQDHREATTVVWNMAPAYEGQLAASEFDPTRDPVMQHLRASSVPLFWGRETYLQAGQAKMFDAMADWGIREGVTVALHVDHDRHFVMGFSGFGSTQPLVPDPLLLTSLQLFSLHAEAAFFRVRNRTELAAYTPDVPLTPRECECLYWAGAGYSDSAIATVLAITHSTVRKHIGNAVEKLNAESRTHAAVIAARLSLTAPFHRTRKRLFSQYSG